MDIRTPELNMTAPDESADAYRAPRSKLLPPLSPQEAVSTPVSTVRLLLIGAGLVVLGLGIWGVW